MLLHRLQQRGLRLRRRAVDLVREHGVGEDRAAHVLEAALPGRVILLEHLRPRDVARHQVRRELHARERQIECLRNRAHEERLGEARHAHEQRVASAQERRDDVVDHRMLAHDPAADLRDELLVCAREVVQQREVVVCGSRDGHWACK